MKSPQSRFFTAARRAEILFLLLLSICKNAGRKIVS